MVRERALHTASELREVWNLPLRNVAALGYLTVSLNPPFTVSWSHTVAERGQTASTGIMYLHFLTALTGHIAVIHVYQKGTEKFLA